MHNFKANYEKILKVLKQISKENLLPYQRRKPVLADIEVISINLTAEYPGIDSECDLFRKLPKNLCSGIERSVYNRRRRRLFPYLEKIRTDLSNSLNMDQDHFMVDSMPLEVCKLSRSSLSKVCRDSGYGAPDKVNLLHRIPFFIRSNSVLERLFLYVSKCQQPLRAYPQFIWESVMELQKKQLDYLC